MTSSTPTYRVELRGVRCDGRPCGMTDTAWNVRQNGAATQTNLELYVGALLASTMPGGVNAHLGRTTVSTARLVRQSTGDVVAEWSAPLFEVVA